MTWSHPALVDVIIPVYNRLKYLDATIQSVLAQTYTHWRLVVVDDGSHEDVASFVGRYTDPRIGLVAQSNQGNAAARNTGIRAREGAYVLCLDSDDVLDPHMLAACASYLGSNPEVDVAYVQHDCIDAQGDMLPKAPAPEPRFGNLLEDLIMGYPILPSSALVRRSCFERWGLYTPGLDDWELWLRWAASGCTFTCIPQPLLSYRIHAENLNLAWECRRDAHLRMLDAFYQREDLPERAISLKERAYATQHARFAVLAWQIDRPRDAKTSFARAIRLNPEDLFDQELYTQIACAHQGRIRAGTADGLDWARAEDAVLGSLSNLFETATPSSDSSTQRGRAYACAYTALARHAYGVARDMGRARCYLARAFAAWPPVLLHSDWSAWLGRAFLGYRTVQSLKRIVRAGISHA